MTTESKKGITQFTKNQANSIRMLIKKKLVAGRNEQKRIRDQIRDIGFYYSRFSKSKHGYTVDDFNTLIAEGKITIIDDAPHPSLYNESRPLYTPATSSTINNGSQASSINSIPAPPTSAKRLKLDQVLNLMKDNRFDPRESDPSIIPSTPGIYLMCLRKCSKLPNVLFPPVVKEFEGLPVIYTGISENLHNRDYKTHFTGNNAGKSTFRKSLGALMKLHFVPRSENNPNDGKTKFDDADEERLSQWMKENLILYFYSTNLTVHYEEQLINYFDPPLNLSKVSKKSFNTSFRSDLSKLRNQKP